MKNYPDPAAMLNHIKNYIDELQSRTEPTAQKPDSTQQAEVIHLIHTLAEARDVAARDYFFAQLTSEISEPDIRLAWVNALGFHWTDFKEATALYASILGNKHEDDSLRSICAAALGAAMDESSLSLLVDVVTGHLAADIYTRRSAASALAQLAQIPYAKHQHIEQSLAMPLPKWFEAVQDIPSLKQAMNVWLKD